MSDNIKIVYGDFEFLSKVYQDDFELPSKVYTDDYELGSKVYMDDFLLDNISFAPPRYHADTTLVTADNAVITADYF